MAGLHAAAVPPHASESGASGSGSVVALESLQELEGRLAGAKRDNAVLIRKWNQAMAELKTASAGMSDMRQGLSAPRLTHMMHSSIHTYVSRMHVFQEESGER